MSITQGGFGRQGFLSFIIGGLRQISRGDVWGRGKLVAENFEAMTMMMMGLMPKSMRSKRR